MVVSVVDLCASYVTDRCDYLISIRAKRKEGGGWKDLAKLDYILMVLRDVREL